MADVPVPPQTEDRIGLRLAEKRSLQIAVAIASIVPIGAGAAGILLGTHLLASAPDGDRDLDSHLRYLSGLLLGVGLGYLATIPRIETRGVPFRLLTFLVVVGGIGRLVSMIAVGPGSPSMLAALAMELLITPCLALWQHRIARMGKVRNNVRETR